MSMKTCGGPTVNQRFDAVSINKATMKYAKKILKTLILSDSKIKLINNYD
jgi:hypothetical protein